jgi:hypothetical protein
MSEENISQDSSSSFWFICLITGVAKSNKDHCGYQEINEKGTSKKKKKGMKKQTDVKRTIVLASTQPVKVLFLMNSGEDDNIVSAAEKAINSRRLSEPVLSSEKGLRKRFEIVCMLGPILDKSLTHKILAGWEKYRGSISRTTIAETIAARFNIKFSINWEILLETKMHNRKVLVLDSQIDGGSTLYVYAPHSSERIEKKDENMAIKEEHQIRPVIKKEKKR